jgi:hypothetical protein
MAAVEDEMALVTLIVMEPGSEWPGQVWDSDNVLAVANDEQGLLERTRARLDSMRQRGQLVRVAVLACNEAADPSSVTRRADLARELLSAVAATGFGRLVLTTTDRLSMRQRCELLSLVGDLSTAIRGARATVSVRFGEPSRREIGLADGIGGEVLAQTPSWVGSIGLHTSHHPT